MRHAMLCMVVLVLFLYSVAHSEIYKWVDQSGRVHFTDNLSSIPPAHQHKAQPQASTPAPLPAPAPALPPQAAVVTPVPISYAVPLRRTGEAMVVQALLNGNVTSPLLVDTGAELTVISPAVARRLGLNLDLAVFIPLRSASGVFLAPLTKIHSLTVGDATVRELEVIVHDAAPGIDGLLGMSFLDNFAVTIRTAEQAMILTDTTTAPGAVLYEGRSKEWWQRKFRFYRRQIEEIRAYMTVQTAPHFERTLRYLQQELAALERRATLASLPKHWR